MKMQVNDKNLNATFAKRILGFSLASWVNCLISIISTPITTALFLPEELGKINLFVSYANVLIPFVYFGFDQAYTRFYYEPVAHNTAKTTFKMCVYISVLLSFPVSFVVLIAWKFFSKSIVGSESFIIAMSVVLYIVATMLLRYTSLKARMDNNIWLFFIQSVLMTLIVKLSYAIVALVQPEAHYAIILKSFLLIITAGVFLGLALVDCRRERVNWNKEAIWELSKFAVPVFPTVFLVMLNSSLSQIVLKEYMEYSTIGIYSNAVTIANIIAIIQSGLSIFWTPFVYEYYKEQRKIQKMHHIISFLLLWVALVIIAFQDLVYLVLVNKDYWASKTIMALLLISPISATISETLGLGIEISKKTYLKFPVYVVSIIVNLVSCITLIPRYEIFGAALSSVFASLSMLITKTIIGDKYYKCSDNYIKLTIGMCIVIISAMISYFFNDGWFKVIVALSGIVVLCLIYNTCVTFLLKNSKFIFHSILKRGD